MAVVSGIRHAETILASSTKKECSILIPRFWMRLDWTFKLSVRKSLLSSTLRSRNLLPYNKDAATDSLVPDIEVPSASEVEHETHDLLSQDSDSRQTTSEDERAASSRESELAGSEKDPEAATSGEGETQNYSEEPTHTSASLADGTIVFVSEVYPRLDMFPVWAQMLNEYWRVQSSDVLRQLRTQKSAIRIYPNKSSATRLNVVIWNVDLDQTVVRDSLEGALFFTPDGSKAHFSHQYISTCT